MASAPSAKSHLGSAIKADYEAPRSIGCRVMTDKFTRALLAALNESAEVKETDWNSIAELLRDPVGAGDRNRKPPGQFLRKINSLLPKPASPRRSAR